MSKRRDWGSGSITQRSKGHWRVTVDLGRDPVTGKRRRRRFTVKGTKRDALKALNDAISERDHGGVVPNRITTTEWLNKCIAERVTDKKISPLVEDNYRMIRPTASGSRNRLRAPPGSPRRPHSRAEGRAGEIPPPRNH